MSDLFIVITGDSGEFRIFGLPPGTVVFNVRRIGFESASFTAVLKPGKTHRASFPMTATAQNLPTVAVSDTASKTHWLDQFARRKTTNRGTFITRTEIEKRGARTGTDIVPLITTAHPKSGKPLGWTRQEGKSRIVYLQLGHGPAAYGNSNYRKLVGQAIDYVAPRNK